MIHDRDAHADVLRILREQGAPEQVVFHAFSGDAAMARECVAAGYVLSFPGVITFRNAPALREAAAVDADRPAAGRDRRAVPDAAPVPRPAERPASAAADGAGLAAAGGADVDELCAAVGQTGARVFGMPAG